MVVVLVGYFIFEAVTRKREEEFSLKSAETCTSVTVLFNLPAVLGRYSSLLIEILETRGAKYVANSLNIGHVGLRIASFVPSNGLIGVSLDKTNLNHMDYGRFSEQLAISSTEILYSNSV